MNRQCRLRAAERCVDALPEAVFRMRYLQGKSREEVLRAVRDALDEECVPLLEEILEQVRQYDARHDDTEENDDADHHEDDYEDDDFEETDEEDNEEDDDGKDDRVCGFVEWLDYVRTGLALLPEKIPLEVLLVWRDEYQNQPSQGGASPAVRCLRCNMVLPGTPPKPGRPLSGTWLGCSICDSDEFAGRVLLRGGGCVWMKGKQRYAIRDGVAVPE
jgi:hypothetical protein